MLRDDRLIRLPARRRSGFGALTAVVKTSAPVSGGSSGAVITPIAKQPIDAPVSFFPTGKVPGGFVNPTPAPTNPYATWISDERRLPGPVAPSTPGQSIQPPILSQPDTFQPQPVIYDLGPGWTYTPGQGTVRTLPGGGTVSPPTSPVKTILPVKGADVTGGGGGGKTAVPETPGAPVMNVTVTGGTPGATSPESRAAIAAAQKGEINMAGAGSSLVWLGLGVAGLLFVFFKKGR